MKKLLLTILLIFSSLAVIGCDDTESDPVIINIWTYYNDSDIQTFDNFVEKFNSTIGTEKKIKVEHSPYGKVPTLEAALKASINKEQNAKPFPDIFQVYGDTLTALDILNNEVNETDISLPINDYFSNDELSKFNQGYLNDGKIYDDGKVRILPIAKSTEIFMINNTEWADFKSKTSFTDASLSTLEGIVTVAKSYYDMYGKAFYGRDSIENEFYNAISAFDKTVFVTDNNGVTTFDKKQAKDPFEKMYTNYFVPYVRGYFAQKEAYRSSDIKSGTIVSAIASTSGVKSFPTQVDVSSTEVKDIDGAFLPCPTFKDGKKFAIQQGGGFALANNGSEDTVKAAVEFLKYASTAENNATIATSLGYLPGIGTGITYDLVKEDYIITKLAVEGLTDTDANREKITNNKQYSNELKSYDTIINNVLPVYNMHNQKPFSTLSNVRNILRNCIWTQIAPLADFTNADDILKLISEDTSGKDRETLITDYLTQYSFEVWFNAVCTKIENVI